MKQDYCPICKSTDYNVIHNGIRNKVQIKEYKNIPIDMQILKCDNCGLVWLSDFVEDADDFFEKSGMRDFLPQSLKMVRDDMNDETTRYFSDTRTLIKGKCICDFGCGGGGYLLKASEITSGCVGIEMEKSMRDAINQEGIISCYRSIDEIGDVDIFTLFHVLDHIPNPLELLLKMKEKLKPSGKIYIETPNAEDALLTLYQSKEFSDFTYYICHFMYFTNEALKIVAKQAGLKIEFIKQRQRYPLSNHLYWLSQGRPGGHEKWQFLKYTPMDEAYGQLLATLGIADTITCVFTK